MCAADASNREGGLFFGLGGGDYGGRIRALCAGVAWLRARALCAAAAVPALARERGPDLPAYDLIIEHGRVIDGTGAPWYAADVGIRAGRIAAIGRLDKARRQAAHRCRGTGGRARIHRHAGPVGAHAARRSARSLENLSGHHHRDHGRGRIRRAGQRCDRAGERGAFEHLRSSGIGRISPATSRGSRSRASASISLRTSAPPRCARWWSAMRIGPATPAELVRMQAPRRRGDASGGGRRFELARIRSRTLREHRGADRAARTAAEFGGIYATHMRSEQEAIMTSLEETIRIGREAHIPVEIWHLKAGGVKNFRTDARDRRAHRARACRRRRHRRGHLCLPGVGQRIVRLHSALGARRRQCEAHRAAEGSGRSARA